MPHTLSRLTLADRLTALILGMDPDVFGWLLRGDRRYFHTCAWMLLLAMVVAGGGWAIFTTTFYPAAPRWAAYFIGTLVATIIAMFDRALTAPKGPASLRNRVVGPIPFAARLACSVALSFAVSVGVAMVAVAPTITRLQQDEIEKLNAPRQKEIDNQTSKLQSDIDNRRAVIKTAQERIADLDNANKTLNTRIGVMYTDRTLATKDITREYRTKCKELCREAIKRRDDLTRYIDNDTTTRNNNLQLIKETQQTLQTTQGDLDKAVEAVRGKQDAVVEKVQSDTRWRTLATDPLQAFSAFLTLRDDPKLGKAASHLGWLLFFPILALEFGFLLIRLGPPVSYRLLYNSGVNEILRDEANKYHAATATLLPLPLPSQPEEEAAHPEPEEVSPRETTN